MNEQEPDPGTQVPPDDAVVTEWFAPVYPCVYAVLPPFLEMPEEVRRIYGLSDLEGPAIDLPEEQWAQVRWQEVQRLVGVDDAYGLLQLLHYPYPISGFLDQKGLEEPPEGQFPSVLVPRFLRSIADLGHEHVVLSSEGGLSTERFAIADLLRDRLRNLAIWSTMYVDDRSIFYGVNWDSYFVFLCGSRDIVEGTVQRYEFEGFFFEPGMTSWCWSTSNPPLQPTRRTAPRS